MVRSYNMSCQVELENIVLRDKLTNLEKDHEQMKRKNSEVIKGLQDKIREMLTAVRE